jgi:hypothetical protein
MTNQSPRIYTYKITFEEVPYYYYGIHKEKRFNEEYWGSPKTNKWVWEFYTPNKQILQFFEFSEEGWLEANKIEERLIRPFYNTDKWCLNESCGGYISLKIRQENGKTLGLTYGKINGKKLGIKNVETGHIQNLGKIYGNKHKENKTGVCGLTKDELVEIGRKTGYKTYQRGTGVHGLTPEQRTENGKKYGHLGGKVSGKMQYELKIGIHGMSREERQKNAKRTMTELNSQKWMCMETGFISTPYGLSRYQNTRGIDKSKRIRIE